MGSIGELRVAVAGWADDDPDLLDDAALAAELTEVRQLIDALDAAWMHRLGIFDQRGAAAETAATTGSWVRANCRLSPATGRDRIEITRRLRRMPHTAAAYAAGDLSYQHVRLLAAAHAELAAVDAELAAATEPALVDLARLVDPTQLRRELIHARHALIPEEALKDTERQHRRRRLSLSETFEGMVALDGMLDPEGGALLLSALMPLAAPTGPDDDRTPTQRRADALVELVHRHLDAGTLPTTTGDRPHVNIVVDLDTLQWTGGDHADPPEDRPAGAAPAQAAPAPGGPPPAGPAPDAPAPAGPATAAADTPAAAAAAPPTTTADTTPAAVGGTGTSAPTGVSPSGPAGRRRIAVPGPRAAMTSWAGPLHGETARRLACDASVCRIIVAGDSQPLDVGRRTRTIPPAIRTALVVRDGGCVFPGCDYPPQWADAHHVISWLDGGPTSLDNTMLLCRRHHRRVHEGRWQLIRGPDGDSPLPHPRPNPPRADPPRADPAWVDPQHTVERLPRTPPERRRQAARSGSGGDGERTAPVSYFRVRFGGAWARPAACRRCAGGRGARGGDPAVRCLWRERAGPAADPGVDRQV